MKQSMKGFDVTLAEDRNEAAEAIGISADRAFRSPQWTPDDVLRMELQLPLKDRAHAIEKMKNVAESLRVAAVLLEGDSK